MHEVPRETWVKVKDEDWAWADDAFLFHKMDGSYAQCQVQGGGIIHLNAMLEVEVVDAPQ